MKDGYDKLCDYFHFQTSLIAVTRFLFVFITVVRAVHVVIVCCATVADVRHFFFSRVLSWLIFLQYMLSLPVLYLFYYFTKHKSVIVNLQNSNL